MYDPDTWFEDHMMSLDFSTTSGSQLGSIKRDFDLRAIDLCATVGELFIANNVGITKVRDELTKFLVKLGYSFQRQKVFDVDMHEWKEYVMYNSAKGLLLVNLELQTELSTDESRIITQHTLVAIFESNGEGSERAFFNSVDEPEQLDIDRRHPWEKPADWWRDDPEE